MIPINVTVQYQEHGNKRSARLKLALDMTVAQAVEAIIGALQLSDDTAYRLVYQRHPLDATAKLFSAGLQEGSIVQLDADDANATIMDVSNARVLAAGVLQRLGGRTGSAEVELLPIRAALVAESGQVFMLQRTRALIGRADEQIGYPPEMFDAELSALDDNRSVSRPHALIVYADGVFTIRDLYSRHGVFVNDEKLSSSGAQQIYDGDVIRIGEIVFQFRLL
jgi:hypothetical protein